MVSLRVVPSAELTTEEWSALTDLCVAAFDEAWDSYWRDIGPGVHVLAEDPERGIVGHAAIVDRLLYPGEATLRAGYVEAVAVWPDLQAGGVGTAVMTAINRLKQGSVSLKLVVGEMAAGAAPAPEAGEAMAFADRISVEALHYRYPEAESEALKGISLEIRRGEMVGFVGRSGSGKTSLVDCILGLLTPSQGRIRVDGVDIQDNLGGWRRQIGYIPQDIYLTDDSLRRNIALGLDDGQIDEARVWAALEAAQMAEFARGLPAALETAIGERGVRLSGGQRQRIGIARAIYNNPSVLVLDEATSALDHQTEKAIVNTIGGLKGSRTIIVIAHRLTTIEDCDRVLMLDHGLLVEPADPALARSTPGQG